MQVPTLVLDPWLYPLPPISRDNFNISLDSGPRFHPTQMHIEGDDPIDLAILLDVSGDAYYLQSALSRSISSFVTKSLLPHDRISIYAIDCAFIRTADNMPAIDNVAITQSLNAAIHDPRLHGPKANGPHCGRSIKLWGALGTVAKYISNAPGHRIILAISAGQDHHDVVKWKKLKHYVGYYDTTIFGMYPEIGANGNQFDVELSTENPFNQLCQLTGGMVLFSSGASMPGDLKHFIDLVRSRYILEFPLPDKHLARDHQYNIDITVAHTDAFIRPASISFIFPNAALLSSPTTIPSPASPAVIGSRHTLAPQ